MNIAKPRDVGRLIRARRRQLGWSQAALADRVHTTRRWISEIEHGKPTAEIGLVLATLQALGIAVRVEPVTVGHKPARPQPTRPPQPTIADLTDLLEQHVERGAPKIQQVSFSRKRGLRS
jgi:HTH-type transcriptional regulator/antitoxin HipB